MLRQTARLLLNERPLHLQLALFGTHWCCCSALADPGMSGPNPADYFCMLAGYPSAFNFSDPVSLSPVGTIQVWVGLAWLVPAPP